MATYKRQSLLSINLDTEYANLASASTKSILYKKPDGTRGSYTATVSGTELVYNFADGDIDQQGTWQFQSYIVLGGLKGYGEIVSVKFEIPLN